MSDFLDNVESDLKDIAAGEWSLPVVITVGSVVFSGDGIFDKFFIMLDTEGAPIQSDHPQFSMFVKDVDDLLGEELSEDQNAVVAVGEPSVAVSFRIAHVERDGTGWGSIRLRNVIA